MFGEEDKLRVHAKERVKRKLKERLLVSSISENFELAH